ncbi:OPT oligopeptide transporter protein-domain-containing protein [Mycena rosella]|uniref:OPT oligopeptide transporter protein-domain-containing protein n=1 Tax=Mycena rosella TaxID=1033263 RepID=A0AAD7DSB6_MYCRO|nr:OPT oligopeptide transporter protein-domain-containing protein [Mycena rosella]
MCWIGGRNKAANFIGSGMGGMGVLNFTLGVSNITLTIVTQPFFVHVILFTGFVITIGILVPIAYFGNIWGSPTYNVMSNGLFTKNGSAYPFTSLPYTAFMSALVWMSLFAGPQILAAVKSVFTGKRVHHDRLSNIMKIYPEVSVMEWVSSFALAFIALLAIVIEGHVYMPVFTLFVALAVGAISTLPMSFVYAISGYQVDVGYVNELIYGYMLQAPGASRHPLGQLAYRIMSDAAMLWVLSTRLDYLREIKIDPNGEWTGQILKSSNTVGIQYALVGPRNLFADGRYQPLWYGFAVGAAAPLIIWVLDRRSKNATSVTVVSNQISVDTGFSLNLLVIFISLGVAGIAMPTWWGNNAISIERCFGKGK